MHSATTTTPTPSTWHSTDIEEIERILEAKSSGLTSAEAESRLAKFGPNRLPEQPPPSVWAIIARQFKSPLIYILAAAAVVSLFMQDYKDALFIAIVLVLNGAIGAYQEWRAEKNSQALRKMLQIRATVVRDGEQIEIPAESVVPGDVVILESGNRVPADLRLISGTGLEADESFLTGESLPVAKDPDWRGDEQTVLGDRLNMAFAGATVTRGRAQGIAVATGSATTVGQLALDVMTSRGGKPPLLERMERFTRFIAIAVLIAAAVVGAVGFSLGRYQLHEMFLFCVALAVSAIPEGLPVAMTVALAIATARMASRGVIVRRLTAVEGLGSCTYVATDKTGTLTCNMLTVREVQPFGGAHYTVSGEGFEPNGEVRDDNDQPVDLGKDEQLERLARVGVLCNEADLHQGARGWHHRGDSVDLALLCFGLKLGLSREQALKEAPLLAQIPFEPEYQYAATFHRADSGRGAYVCVKGAPERVAEMCALTNEQSRDLENSAITLTARGYRVLALADGHIETFDASSDPPDRPSNLNLLGLVAMIDPLRPGARDAVHACHDAGISVSMVTGDHRLTALAIARDLDLAHEEHEVITGEELKQIPQEQWTDVINRVRVYARVEPRQKLEIVNAARAAGHYVAVTGDGVNDAPALRAANIGVAMGKSGTDVAREASELVISDDNFSTIVAGVEEGRVAYDNIRKVIFLLISTGAAEIVVMGMAVITGLPLPLLPVQILWLNLVTNGIQDVALAFEPAEDDVLRRKPRKPAEPIFDRLMIERSLVTAFVMGLVGVFTFKFMIPAAPTDSQITAARNVLLLLMVLFENFHIGNCRSETKSAFALPPWRSPILMGGALTAFLLHLFMMYTPIGTSLLGAEPVSLQTWIILILLASTIIPAIELHKFFWERRKRAGLI